MIHTRPCQSGIIPVVCISKQSSSILISSMPDNKFRFLTHMSANSDIICKSWKNQQHITSTRVTYHFYITLNSLMGFHPLLKAILRSAVQVHNLLWYINGKFSFNVYLIKYLTKKSKSNPQLKTKCTENHLSNLTLQPLFYLILGQSHRHIWKCMYKGQLSMEDKTFCTFPFLNIYKTI